ncbi:MAG: TonB-dependent receptor plug domain-containing protein, partial [Caulobacteraceae bacterium]
MTFHKPTTRLQVSARAILSVGVAMGGLATAGAVRAAPAADAAAPTAVEEVIVTAQKREQRLQDVPVAVTVLKTKQLEQTGVRSVKDLTLLTPGFNAATNGDEATTTVRIRGIGTVADNPGLEDAVGIYIDGVYRPRNGVSFNNLGELSDVEVLKGPQGTLFGKNTVAGVLQITTKRPSFTFGGDAEFDVQNYDGFGGHASVTGPLIGDILAGRLFFADYQRDGYIPVIQAPTTDSPAQTDEHVYTVRGQLLYQPTSNFDITVIADYTKRDDHCCTAVG